MKLIDIQTTLQKLDAADGCLTRYDARHTPNTPENHFDADILPWFARQLESVSTRLLELPIPDLIAANGDLLPFAEDVEDGAPNFVYYLYGARGIAEFLDDYSAEMAPEVTIEGARKEGPVKQLTLKYGWTVNDIIRSRRTGFGLDMVKARRARRGHEVALHFTVLWGRADLGLEGFVNNPSITISLAADNGSGSTYWIDKTLAQIIEDIGTIVHGTQELANDAFAITDVRIANKEFDMLSRRMAGAEFGSSTFLDRIRQAFSGVQFNRMRELQKTKSKNAAGAEQLTSNAALAYVKDPEYADIVQPRPYTEEPVQREGMKFVIYTHSTTGGVRMPQPLSVNRMDEIGNS